MTRILAVDDSRSMRRMVSFALRTSGFEVLEATDGQEAFEMARKEQVDLVLTDINMPRMGGIELIRRLRETPSYKYTPILTLTTESSAARKAEGKAAGATGWIVKPFEPHQLVCVVERLTQ